MKKYLIALLLVCNTYLSAAGWQPNASTIPLGSGPGASIGVYIDVTVAYFPAIKKVVAAWADSSPSAAPYYSIYDGIADTWTTAALISSNTRVEQNVNLQSFPFKKILVAAWSDQASHLPYYSYFDGTVWTTPQVFVIGDPTTVADDIGLAYDKVGHRIFAAWGNFTTGAPTYSIFDSTLTWTAPQLMYLPLIFPVENNINLSYDIASGEVIAAWALTTTRQPTYSIFSGGGWSEPAAIPTGGSNGVHDDVRLVFDRTMNVVLAAWADDLGYQIGYGAYYNGSWTATGAFNLDGSIGIYDNVSLGYNLITGAVFTVWQDSENSPGTGKPFYNIEPGPIVGAIPPGLSAGVDYNVNIAYDQNSGKMVAVWGNYPGTPTPYYNTYQ